MLCVPLQSLSSEIQKKGNNDAKSSRSCVLAVYYITCVPRQELKWQLETAFEGSQLVNVAAETFVSIVVPRTELLHIQTQRE